MEGLKSLAAIVLGKLLTQLQHMGYQSVPYKNVNWGTVANFEILPLARVIHPPRWGVRPPWRSKNWEIFFFDFSLFCGLDAQKDV